MLVLLTATGGRPGAFTVCSELMHRQTYPGQVKWVIVDDCIPVTTDIQDNFRENWEIVHLYRTPAWEPGQNTQAQNLLLGLSEVSSTDTLLIVEDDDYYHPTYIQRTLQNLELGELVGEVPARYYNYPQRTGRVLSNKHHASLCSTGMRGSALQCFREAVQRSETYIDLDLWGSFQGKKYLRESGLVVGVKGLPGRGGIGMGHVEKFLGIADPELELFKQWVQDYELYKVFDES